MNSTFISYLFNQRQNSLAACFAAFSTTVTLKTKKNQYLFFFRVAGKFPIAIKTEYGNEDILHDLSCCK